MAKLDFGFDPHADTLEAVIWEDCEIIGMVRISSAHSGRGFHVSGYHRKDKIPRLEVDNALTIYDALEAANTWWETYERQKRTEHMIAEGWIEIRPGMWQMGEEARKKHGPQIRAELQEIYRRLELEDIKKELAEIIKEDTIDTWLATPNQAFGMTPLEMINQDKSSELREMIYRLRSGTPA